MDGRSKTELDAESEVSDAQLVIAAAAGDERASQPLRDMGHGAATLLELDGREHVLTVHGGDPLSYKKRVREYLRERGEPIPAHLYDDGDPALS
ncbi:MAG TPA: hypothetical protein VLC10_00585 [Patescibacteria group bacterium]|nr:hypothetical protein [Patescibacteria group bacterium]